MWNSNFQKKKGNSPFSLLLPAIEKLCESGKISEKGELKVPSHCKQYRATLSNTELLKVTENNKKLLKIVKNNQFPSS